jgi:hypothetical protein
VLPVGEQVILEGVREREEKKKRETRRKKK